MTTKVGDRISYKSYLGDSMLSYGRVLRIFREDGDTIIIVQPDPEFDHWFTRESDEVPVGLRGWFTTLDHNPTVIYPN
jgi:hypothetical protein